MTGPPSLAAVLASGEAERLYSGLSLLVSAAAAGRRSAALASFAALDVLLDPDPRRRASTTARPQAARFADSFAELVETARRLPSLELYACSASVATMGLVAADVAPRLPGGVMSTPSFLMRIGDATLLFV